MAVVRVAIGLVAIILIAAVGASGAQARDIVSTSFDAPSVELLGVVDRVQSTNSEIVVEIPAREGAPKSATTVTAKGLGDLHRWVVFTLHNPEPVPRDFVVSSRWDGFVGSGLVWPRHGGRQVLAIRAAPGLQPGELAENTADAFALRIGPGETITYVLELAGSDISNLSLWQRSAFDARNRQLSFFRGVVLGLAALTAVFVICLFVVRMQAVFPAATLFALAAVGFIALGFGYSPRALPFLGSVGGVEDRVRAIVEVLLASGALACLLTFVDLTRRMPAAGYTVMGLLAGSLGLAVFGWFDPPVVTGLARFALLFTALGGLAIALLLWKRGTIRAQASLVFWVFLALWTLFAMAAAMGWIAADIVYPVLAWGLVLVLLTMSFTVAQFAFNQGVMNSRFFEDSGRRALALAGAEQSVWDWNEDRGRLFVGAELERALGLAPGRLTRGGLKAWLELIHPADRAAYVSAVESAVRRGRGTFAQDLRLRRGDGTYRWYQLRARALPGAQGRATRCIGTLADITGRKRSEEQILFDAVHDRITGLPNRALFMDRLERAMTHARTVGGVGGLSVLVIDLDRFKHVNDGLGHAVGDSLLLTLARRLAAYVGPEDTLARLVGDQFGIILDTTRLQMPMEAYVDELRKTIAQPIPLRPREVFLTASIGVAGLRAEVERPEDLFHDAEIALYEAKRTGRDAAIFFRPVMRDQRYHRVVLEADLRRALERNEIDVVYQPIMRLGDMKLVGFEALVRWHHITHGTLEPEAFIKLAEETGVIMDLGSYVLNEAARQLGIWQRAFRPHDSLFVTVNLSSRELITRDLVDEVKTLLNREDLAPGSLKLELTESVVMENPELSVQILQKLRQLGIGIACDDFGTGYSSLGHLARLPFDMLKIDRSFLELEQDEEETTQIILDTIVMMAHDLGMDVVSEGIETAEQAAWMGRIGCDFGQGYQFSEPLSARQVVDMLGAGGTLAARWGRARRSVWQRLTGTGDRGEQAETAAKPAGADRQAPTLEGSESTGVDERSQHAGTAPPPPPPPELEAEEGAETGRDRPRPEDFGERAADHASPPPPPSLDDRDEAREGYPFAAGAPEETYRPWRPGDAETADSDRPKAARADTAKLWPRERRTTEWRIWPEAASLSTARPVPPETSEEPRFTEDPGAPAETEPAGETSPATGEAGPAEPPEHSEPQKVEAAQPVAAKEEAGSVPEDQTEPDEPRADDSAAVTEAEDARVVSGSEEAKSVEAEAGRGGDQAEPGETAVQASSDEAGEAEPEETPPDEALEAKRPSDSAGEPAIEGGKAESESKAEAVESPSERDTAEKPSGEDGGKDGGEDVSAAALKSTAKAPAATSAPVDTGKAVQRPVRPAEKRKVRKKGGQGYKTVKARTAPKAKKTPAAKPAKAPGAGGGKASGSREGGSTPRSRGGGQSGKGETGDKPGDSTVRLPEMSATSFGGGQEAGRAASTSSAPSSSGPAASRGGPASPLGRRLRRRRKQPVRDDGQ
ncbi:EAL domain-containing protein [Kaustia mangrovi]|uniref:EAL domain-containing protein n=1 Tax=Kaustia mangrovi TaxID=2593653 RepID=A0A7S8C2F6_9HYPH|nr:EAL domain-containing protein [Kaustia mangrovi]QPC42129.1 EAL domain-containing protein [Kaustia mangrovi]